MLYKNEGLGRGFLERIATALKVDVEPLLRFEGKPLRTFYTEAVCGGVILSLSSAASRSNVEVPMAFQSALAGILLGAEVFLDAGGIRKRPMLTTTTIDLLKPLGSYLSFAHQKHPSGKCICQDNDFVHRYREKYGLDSSNAVSPRGSSRRRRKARTNWRPPRSRAGSSGRTPRGSG